MTLRRARRWQVCWVTAIALIGCGAGLAPPRPAPERRPAPMLARVEASLDGDGHRVGASDAPTILVVFASWCTHCKVELDVLGELRAAHPHLRVLGINYRGHEEYAQRGSSSAVRAYVAASAPWLRVVPADDALFASLGRPAKVPTLYVFDRTGTLVTIYDRRARAMPNAAELEALLRRLGA